MPPFKGTKGKDLSIEIDGTEYNTDLKAFRCEPDDGEDIAFKTFARMKEGDTKAWFIRGTGFQDFQTSSFWTYIWLNAGQNVPFIARPYGNEVATADQPHFTGTCTIVSKAGFGGDADEEHEFEVEWPIDGVPLRVTA
ncbi:hypothetical protein CH249_14655 [Rhodococcus sp. 05-2255-3B1]|uniref:hypothetical protein n=1 Tax=unclassified Rhodococcus (in: high G+C Gram-positive bacteria) TaxID=192944 RepID=UPI000B9BAA7C|nr:MULTISPECIES: hypothetical protein [unclassified Rhodococcus (in: high G+C Gram-positive bacteria)]OZE03054.1 hypothetical protein CH250_22720 [Rhodococcus sp. 05-2255-3C]OZE09444.1 hypothetical protein CH249_14655 [Rhodococcus sp. 05-2255-3B1]